jgi:hypothetical protein
MYRLVLKRTLHDRKLPAVVPIDVRPVFVKGSENSPRKADYSKKEPKQNIPCCNLKKYGWFTK